MRTSEERIQELHHRMGDLKQARIRQRYILICSAAYAVCIAVLGVLAAGVSRLPVRTNSILPGNVTASIFSNHETLGYVVVVLAALCLGVTVTVFCFRLKQNMEKEERNDYQKKAGENKR